MDEKPINETEAENVNADTAIAASDDDASMPAVRYMNPVSVRDSSHPQWGLERDFVSVVRSGEGFSRCSRHGLPRIRGGRTRMHLESLHIDPETSMSNTEMNSSQDHKKKSPEVIVMENLNKFASTGTFEELLNTFEATSQLIWTLPYSASTSSSDHEKSEGIKLSHSSWLLDTLQSYCRLLEFFINSTFLLPPTSTSQSQLLVQPVAVGLSIGLFPVLRDPEVFVRMLQSQVLDVILPIWNHQMFPSCNPGFITTIVTLVTHIFCGVGDAKRSRGGGSGGSNQRFIPPPPDYAIDEATIATIVEMGFTRSRAEEANLPSTFLDAIMDGVICSAEAITCIPQCLDALCLSNSGLQAVKDRNALRCFVKIFTSHSYLRALMGDTPTSLSSGLDELMRHAASLRGHGVDMLIEILKAIEKLGCGPEVTSSTVDVPSSSSSPMETDADDKSGESSKTEPSSDTSSLNIESFLPDCVNNAAHLLETILQNSNTCRIFVEKKGIEVVLQLFTLPLMPPSISIGQSISIAFKNFSPHHSASIARALSLFLRKHLKVTNELLTSLGGMQLAQMEGPGFWFQDKNTCCH